jgi:hypothetical protein
MKYSIEQLPSRFKKLKNKGRERERNNTLHDLFSPFRHTKNPMEPHGSEIEK